MSKPSTSPALALATAAAVLVLTGSIESRAAFCSGTLGAFGWLCTTVDTSGDVASMSRLTYSADGSPMIAYTQIVKTKGLSLVTALKFATRSASGTWSATTLDSSVGGPSAIRVNPVTGYPAISYGCVKLAERTSTGWQLQSVAAPRECGGTTFAFDQSGIPHVAYSDTKTKRVAVGARAGNSWSFQTLTVQACYMSLDVGPDGLPALAVEDMVSRGLVYVNKTVGGTWQYTTVDPVAPATNSSITHVTLRFDAAGVPTVAYRNGPSVRFARRDPATGLWGVEIVHAIRYPSTVSMDDAGGEPVVAFHDIEAKQMLISRRDAGLAAWQTSVIGPSDVFSAGGTGYDAVHDLVGTSYGPRDISDLLFAEGPRLAVGQ